MPKEVLRYFALTYAVTWVFTIPFVILYNTVMNQALVWWAFVFLPGQYGPTIAALWLVRRHGGPGAVRAQLRRLTQWRAAARWYAFAFLPTAVVALTVPLSSFRSVALGGFDPVPGLAIIPLALIAGLPFGPLGEELGWRGYAQPRLLSAMGVWKASLILGAVWTFWHTPMFWFPGAAIPSFLEPGPLAIGLYFAQVTAEACLLTFLYVRSGGNILLAVLFHLSFNTAETIVYRMFPEFTDAQKLELYVMGIAVSCLIAAVLLSRLSRKSAEGN